MDRRDLVSALQDQGFTFRDAREIVSALVDSMREGLKRDGVLDIPIGRLRVERRRPIRGIRFGKIARIYRRPKITFEEAA